MAKTTTTYVQVQAPEWVTAETFKKATPILVEIMSDLAGKDEVKRGYILAANRDGFPVKAGFASGNALDDLCIRAFWFAFEKITAGKTLPSETA